MSVKLGIMVDAQEGLGWEEWTAFAGQIEESGYESLWRSDHLTSLVGHPERSSVDAWISLAYLAIHTVRLRFGTLVSPLTWRHPSILAQTAASVDALSAGRLEVGIGAGWNSHEHNCLGIDLPPFATRLQILEEGAQVIRLLWSARPASFAGQHFSLSDACGNPTPAQTPGPPLVLGGIADQTLAIVARQADEWNAYGLTPSSYRAKLAVLGRECEKALRPIWSLRRSIAAPFAIGRSDSEVRERIRAIEEYFPLPLMFPPDRAPFSPEVLRDLGWIVGSPETVVEQIEALAAEGVHRVVLHHLDLRDRASLELIADSVLPEVQGR